ncbi:MAG: hypothetical protein ACLP9L_04845, partial [Thermoguttaceae bacterium]
MSTTPKDLQDVFEGVMNAFQPGDVSRVAEVVGVKVIADLPRETKNARLMTAMPGGGKPPGGKVPSVAASSPEEPEGSMLGNRVPIGPTSASPQPSMPRAPKMAMPAAPGGYEGGERMPSTLGGLTGAKPEIAAAAKPPPLSSFASRGPGTSMPYLPGRSSAEAGNGPKGTKSSPFSVDVSAETCRNLAKLIAEAQKKEPQPGYLERFFKAFGRGASTVQAYSPMVQGKEWLAGKVKGLLGIKPEKEEEPQPLPNAVMDIARRNAGRNARFTSRYDKLFETDRLAAEGTISKQGYSQQIASPGPPPKTPGLGTVSAETGRAASTAGTVPGTVVPELAETGEALGAVSLG